MAVLIRYLGRLLAPVLLALAASPLFAANFVILNGDGAGEGFNDPTPVAPVGGNSGATLGAQRLQVFEEAARIWGEVLNSSVPIRVEANFNEMSCGPTSGILGGAGPISVIRDFSNAPLASTWYHIALANALSGTDLIPSGNDIRATFNSALDNNDSCLTGTNWYLGLDHNEGGDIDLLAVVLHEFGHGLGFSSLIDEATGNWFYSIPDAYGSLIRDNSLGLLWTQMSSVQRRSSAVNAGNVVWTGATVSAAAGFLGAGTDGQGRVLLYTPNPVQAGSSVSHWDRSATPNLLMEPYITSGLQDLDLTDEQMADIGWQLNGQPVCGNGILEAGEQCDGSDFGTASCGDYGGIGALGCTSACTIDSSSCVGSACNLNGVCDAGEDCSTCGDCISGPIAGAVCGNNICEAGDGENCLTCPSDCNGTQSGKPSGRFCCGAEGGSNNVGCGTGQCGSCTTTPAESPGTYCCGDSQCGGEETPFSCGLDCGSCSITELPESSCSDGVDNDCDGAIDAADSDCISNSCSPERGKRCSDNVDNDCDGLVDAADDDCA